MGEKRNNNKKKKCISESSTHNDAERSGLYRHPFNIRVLSCVHGMMKIARMSLLTTSWWKDCNGQLLETSSYINLKLHVPTLGRLRRSLALLSI